jgi:MtN3 and saliva related transmembrane protein
MREFIALVFGFGMVVNALLFLPQALTILRSQRAEGVSIITFLGFNAMQAIGVLHGWLDKDWPLAVGMLASLITCGSVTILALIFRSSTSN